MCLGSANTIRCQPQTCTFVPQPAERLSMMMFRSVRCELITMLRLFVSSASCLVHICGLNAIKICRPVPVSYTHLRAHETPEHLVCRLLLEKKKKTIARIHDYSNKRKKNR
eukprot:TRINITY_DN18241_c0_g1_i1.p1 TRINITY_DN18241_c0_g1~~TRINITY_DN18241_c0_g1_i1.p1  ORF type:complete len:111 (+),score=2.71 TRINITY_DN18241_c0_g1_i1:205-537(+)